MTTDREATKPLRIAIDMLGCVNFIDPIWLVQKDGEWEEVDDPEETVAAFLDQRAKRLLKRGGSAAAADRLRSRLMLREVTAEARSLASSRLWSKIAFSPKCWRWTAGLSTDGAPRFHKGSTSVPAQREVYERLMDPIPEGVVMEKRCKDALCVRPGHFRLKSRAALMRRKNQNRSRR